MQAILNKIDNLIERLHGLKLANKIALEIMYLRGIGSGKKLY